MTNVNFLAPLCGPNHVSEITDESPSYLQQVPSGWKATNPAVLDNLCSSKFVYICTYRWKYWFFKMASKILNSCIFMKVFERLDVILLFVKFYNSGV